MIKTLFWYARPCHNRALCVLSGLFWWRRSWVLLKVSLLNWKIEEEKNILCGFHFFSFKSSCASIVYRLNAYASFYDFQFYQICGTSRNLGCSAIAMDCTLRWRNSPEYVLTYTFAYQLKIVLLDATPERNYLVLKTAWPGSVFSENSLTQSVFVFISNINLEGEKNVEKFVSYPSHYTSWSYIWH